MSAAWLQHLTDHELLTRAEAEINAGPDAMLFTSHSLLAETTRRLALRLAEADSTPYPNDED